MVGHGLSSKKVSGRAPSSIDPTAIGAIPGSENSRDSAILKTLAISLGSRRG